MNRRNLESVNPNPIPGEREREGRSGVESAGDKGNPGDSRNFCRARLQIQRIISMKISKISRNLKSKNILRGNV